VVTFGYDIWGNCTTVTDARSIVTKKTYDPTYHMLITNVITDRTGLNLQTQYGCNALMNNISVTNSNNVVISQTFYNALNEPVTISGPHDTVDNPGMTISYDYNKKTSPLLSAGNPTGMQVLYTKSKPVIPGADPVETYTYFNGVGQKITELVKTAANDPLGTPFRTTDYYYEAAGRIIGVTVPYGGPLSGGNWGDTRFRFSTQTMYDFAGRPYKTISPDGTFTQTIYGRIIKRSLETIRCLRLYFERQLQNARANGIDCKRKRIYDELFLL